MEPGAIEAWVWKELVSRLGSYLAAQGITDILIEHASERPVPHPVGGRYRPLWAELQDEPARDQQQAVVPSLTCEYSGSLSEEEPYQEEGE